MVLDLQPDPRFCRKLVGPQDKPLSPQQAPNLPDTEGPLGLYFCYSLQLNCLALCLLYNMQVLLASMIDSAYKHLQHFLNLHLNRPAAAKATTTPLTLIHREPCAQYSLMSNSRIEVTIHAILGYSSLWVGSLIVSLRYTRNPLRRDGRLAIC